LDQQPALVRDMVGQDGHFQFDTTDFGGNPPRPQQLQQSNPAVDDFNSKYIGQGQGGQGQGGQGSMDQGTHAFQHEPWLGVADMFEQLEPIVDKAIADLEKVQVTIGSLPAATRLENTVHGGGAQGEGGSTGDGGADAGGQKAKHLSFLRGVKKALQSHVDKMRSINKDMQNSRDNAAGDAAKAVQVFANFGADLQDAAMRSSAATIPAGGGG